MNLARRYELPHERIARRQKLWAEIRAFLAPLGIVFVIAIAGALDFADAVAEEEAALTVERAAQLAREAEQSNQITKGNQP